MIQVKEFSDTFFYSRETRKSSGQSLEKNINQFLKGNPDIKLIDIKYSQAINGCTDDIDSTSHELVIYEVNGNESN